MSNLRAFPVLLLAACAAAAMAQQDDIWKHAPQSASMKQWQAWYQQRASFFEHKDLKHMKEELDENCKDYDLHGKVLRQGQQAKTWAAIFSSVDNIHANIRVSKVSKVTGGYDATIEYSFQMTTKPGQDHKTHQITTTGTSINNWTQSSGKLQLSGVKPLKVHNTIDGKSVPSG